MAYKCISCSWSDTLRTMKRKFILDTEADLADLPESSPGSLAVVAEGGKAFIVNASGAWVEHGTVALSLAEEGTF